MERRPLACATAALALLASRAHAGTTACWFEDGVLLVPAEALGVAGEYVLDTASPRTQMQDTNAQAAGFADTALVGDIRVAGLTLKGRPVAVTNLDMRTGAFRSVISGVIGADALRGLVLDVSFSPCRVGLYRPGHAPRFGRATHLPMRWIGGSPSISAAVADGPTAYSGAFSPATGADAPVRLSDGLASAPGAKTPKELYPYGIDRPRLRALSFGGALFEDLPAGLIKADPNAPSGEIGAPVLARYRLRFDFVKDELLLKAAK